MFKGTKCWNYYEFDSKILAELSSMANDNVLKPVLDKTYMEHELERAFKYVESGHAIGKVVFKFRYL